MSADTEKIRASLTRTWKTTAEIYEESGIACTNRHCGMSKVARTLNSDCRYGKVEKNVIEHLGRGGKATVWRLVQ